MISKTFIGIYSDAEQNKKVEVGSFNFFQNVSKPELKNAPKKTEICYFTANTLIDALQIAKEKNFTSFAEITGKIYHDKIDY